MSDDASIFSAAEPGLGYIYQPRFALLRALDLPEDCLIHIERNDDVEFVASDGGVSLGSLKHKAVGDRLSDLSTDFWKSVRIWLAEYDATRRLRVALPFPALHHSHHFARLLLGAVHRRHRRW